MTKLTLLNGELRLATAGDLVLAKEPNDEACCCDDKWRCCFFKCPAPLFEVSSITVDITAEDYTFQRDGTGAGGDSYYTLGFFGSKLSGSHTLQRIADSNFATTVNFAKQFIAKGDADFSLYAYIGPLSYYTGAQLVLNIGVRACQATSRTRFVGMEELTCTFKQPTGQGYPADVGQYYSPYSNQMRDWSYEPCAQITADVFSPFSVTYNFKPNWFGGGSPIDIESGSSTVSVTSLTFNK